MRKVIGISGFARSGKDTFAKFTNEEFPEKTVIRSLAYPLKKQVNPFCEFFLGISAFTEWKEHKETIRPILIFWGQLMRKFKKDYWLQKLSKEADSNYKSGKTTLIPDVRFLNEAEYCKKNGLLIYVEREGNTPTGYIEEETALLKKEADLIFYWKNIDDDFNILGRQKVLDFLKDHNIC